MTKLISKLIKKYQRWKCRRDFRKLDAAWQRRFTLIGLDPNSKIKRGEL